MARCTSWPRLPQRGCGRNPQPRIHGAGGVPPPRRLRADAPADRTAHQATPRGRVFGTVQLPLAPKSSLERVLTDVSGPWRVVSVCDALSEALGRRVDLQTDFEAPGPRAAPRVRVHEGMGPGAIIEELYGELVEAVTVEPTFYTDFPAETSPLAAPHRSVPGLAERWDLVINGMEMGCAYWN